MYKRQCIKGASVFLLQDLARYAERRKMRSGENASHTFYIKFKEEFMYQRKRVEIIRKYAALTLIFMMLVSLVPSDAFAAVEWRPGTKVYFSQGASLKGSDDSSRGNRYFYHHGSKYTNRWPNSTGTGWKKEDCYSLQTPIHSYTVKPINGGSSKIAYCLEQNVRNPASGNTRYTACLLYTSRCV